MGNVETGSGGFSKAPRPAAEGFKFMIRAAVLCAGIVFAAVSPCLAQEAPLPPGVAAPGGAAIVSTHLDLALPDAQILELGKAGGVE